MFESTLPAEKAASMRASEFERQAAARHGDAQVGGTNLVGLSPTLLQDLQRFDPGIGHGLDLLQVLAAALRHDRALRVHLECDYRGLALSVWPRERVVFSPLPLPQLMALRLPDLRVLRVESLSEAPASQAEGSAPLGMLLWELALRGARDTLLPEIAGPAAYRVSPGADLDALALGGTLADAVKRLRREITPLRELAAWPGFDHDRAVRLLNGLYLHSALMVSRSHPAALGPQ